MRNGSCPRSAASRDILCPRRHLLSATGWRHEMADRFTVWNQITGATATTV
jgi:hypothetical protein